MSRSSWWLSRVGVRGGNGDDSLDGHAGTDRMYGDDWLTGEDWFQNRSSDLLDGGANSTGGGDFCQRWANDKVVGCETVQPGR